MRIRLSAWARRTFDPDSRPCSQTLRNMARRGDVPGAFRDSAGRWWVRMSDERVANLDAAIDRLIGDDAKLAEALR